MTIEAKLKAMTTWVKSLNSLLSVIREEDYLVVEHDDYGHVTELHPEDFPNYKEIVREAIAEASGESRHKEALPWD